MRDVETRLLRSFIVVAAKQSVSQGAKRLGWSQGTMSLRISKLEEDLGLQLFKRGRYNFKLTPAGRDLLPDAQALLDMHDRLFDGGAQSSSRAWFGWAWAKDNAEHSCGPAGTSPCASGARPRFVRKDEGELVRGHLEWVLACRLPRAVAIKATGFCPRSGCAGVGAAALASPRHQTASSDVRTSGVNRAHLFEPEGSGSAVFPGSS